MTLNGISRIIKVVREFARKHLEDEE